MKMFENCIVQSTAFPELNGMRVTRTIRWCYNGDIECKLYEVRLEDGNVYQLNEDEMTVNKNWKPE